MPISILAPAPPTFGPGLRLNLQSSVISPNATGVTWTVDVFGGPEERNVLHQVLVGQSNVVDGQLGLQPQGGFRIPDVGLQPGTGITINLHAQADSTGEIDTGTSDAFVWEPVISAWALQPAASSSSGGLTEEQALQLTNTDRRTQLLGEPVDLVVDTPSGPFQFTLSQLFSRQRLDQLTLSEITSGPTCDPVRFTFSQWYSGVVVRLTTIAPDLTPKTPDLEWYFPDLAVLRVFRGPDLKFRRGIHTPTYMTDERWEWNWNIREVFEMLGGPPATTVAVDWRSGCCGQVFLLRFP